MLKNELKKYFDNKRVLILGFGREGQSSYRLIRRLLPELTIGIADKCGSVSTEFPVQYGYDTNVVFHSGDDYLDSLHLYDIVIKSPGISYKLLADIKDLPVITSQTEIFIKLLRDRIIGITGTKGKSTTASLVFHILKEANKEVVFVGNIGVPLFECLDSISNRSWIVCELSSHQLDKINVSPHISILLNIYQEHLDHYNSYDEYQLAKYNIALYQSENDYFIYNSENEVICDLIDKSSLQAKLISFGNSPKGNMYCKLSGNDIISQDGNVLKDVVKDNNIAGKHNLYNVMAAVVACRIAGIGDDLILDAISTFTGLPHRLEYIGKFGGISYYNDSIATIPEATIEATNTVRDLDTIILGGYDRGVDYSVLAGHLVDSSISNFILTGDAGKRIFELMVKKDPDIKERTCLPDSFDEAVKLAVKLTANGKSCLLSPAASSYDMFRDFEERGERFKELVEKYSVK